jgi:Uma2 family endonuclease
MRTVERRAKVPAPEPAVNGRVAFRLAGRVNFPAWIKDHESFRKWARSPECPEHLRVAFYDDSIWVDPDMEQLYAHNQVKAEVSAKLGTLVRAGSLGRFIIEGMLLSNVEAKFSTIPDGYFVSYEAFRSGRVRQFPGKQGGCIELEGTPEMIVEVVSDSSVQKDTVDMPPKYYAAGVQEYWTIDVRSDEPVFQVWKRGPKGFVSARRQAAGWHKSDVFGRSFRLVAEEDELGEPLYTLQVK